MAVYYGSKELIIERVTAADKRLVRKYLYEYVQQGGDGSLSMQAFQRALQWSDGYTFAEIGKNENVSQQTVGVQVRAVVYKLREYTKGNK